MRVFHLALREDWAAAKDTGSYTVSTLGRTLQEVGFIHAARADQVATVYDAFYADRGLDLVLLTIDTDRLTARWSEDPVGDTTYPHIHGPLDVAAVVEMTPYPTSAELS